MKGKRLFYAAIAMLSLTLSSCEKETEGVTRITYFPTIELNGDAVMQVAKGEEYVEPGYVSMMNGEDVTSGVIVSSNVDTEHSGVYSIQYVTVTNEDGFSSSATRTVVVLDANDPIEGFYTVTPDSYRDYGGSIVEFANPYEVLIIGEGNGVYSIDDLFAGWYSQRAGYGEAYNCSAYFTVEGSNMTVDPSDTYVAGWGDSIDSFHDASYNASENTFSYAADYAGAMTFYITLVKE